MIWTHPLHPNLFVIHHHYGTTRDKNSHSSNYSRQKRTCMSFSQKDTGQFCPATVLSLSLLPKTWAFYRSKKEFIFIFFSYFSINVKEFGGGEGMKILDFRVSLDMIYSRVWGEIRCVGAWDFAWAWVYLVTLWLWHGKYVGKGKCNFFGIF